MRSTIAGAGLFDHPDFDGHDQVVFVSDPASGLRAIIAVHETTLGPAPRRLPNLVHASEAEAVADALRLSRGMSTRPGFPVFRSAAAGR